MPTNCIWHLNPPKLLQHTINLILIFQLKCFGRLIVSDALSVEQEAEGIGLDSLSGCISGEYFAHLGRLFDLKDSLFSSLLMDLRD